MLSLRLVRLIEDHAEELAGGLIERLRQSARRAGYLPVPEEELRQGTIGIYRHLGDWLLTKTDTEIENRFVQAGRTYAQQGVELATFVWALIITKENLWSFLQSHAQGERVPELYGELEFVRLVDRFFDRAIYYAALGYQHAEDKTETAA